MMLWVPCGGLLIAAGALAGTPSAPSAAAAAMAPARARARDDATPISPGVMAAAGVRRLVVKRSSAPAADRAHPYATVIGRMRSCDMRIPFLPSVPNCADKDASPR